MANETPVPPSGGKPPQDKLDTIIQAFNRQSGEGPKESDLYAAFKFFVSEDGIFGKTKINAAQRNLLWVLSLMDKKHPEWKLKEDAEKLALLFISEHGDSRRGMIDLFKGLLQHRQPDPGMETKPVNVKGGRGGDF